MTNVAFAVSAHPVTSLIMRVVFFCLIVALACTGNKINFVYLYLLSYPFLRISFSNINIFLIVSLILTILFYKDILNYYKTNTDLYNTCFILIGVSLVESTVISQYPHAAIENIFIVISYYAYYLILTIYLKDFANTRKLIYIISAITVFALLITCWQALFGVSSVRLFFGEYNWNVGVAGYAKRVPSFFDESQSAGLYFSFTTILFAGVSSTYFKGNYLYKLLPLACFAGILLSGTRIAVFALLCGFATYYLFTVSVKNFMILISSVFLLTLFLNCVPTEFLPRAIQDRFEKRHVSKTIDFRYQLWKESLPIILNHPLGVGMGGENLYAAGRKLKVLFLPAFTLFPEMRKYTHFENTFLEILYSLGIIGFSGFILLIVRFMRSGVIFRRKSENDVQRRFCAWLMATIVVWLLSVGVSPKFLLPQMMILLLLLLAMMNAMYQSLTMNTVSEQTAGRNKPAVQ